MQTLLALDKAQKGQPLTETQRNDLIARGYASEQRGSVVLVRPAPPASEAEAGSASRKAAGLADAIREALSKGPATRVEIAAALAPAFDKGGDFGERVYRALRKLESEGAVSGEGSTRARTWKLK